MSSRMKEEERIERIIRGLLKLQENRRCINCNSLGPQYVCTTFWTFVCTNCSGVHREFTHRVKSVSMAKFKAEEVSALQAGGNERARQIYFKSWDPQRHSFPDGSNLLRLRDFIKHVYVDRKYTGERSVDKIPMGEEDSYERHSIERSSPRRRDERRYYIEERRSPRYKKENVRSNGSRARPVNFEIVDDRFRDDGSESGRRSESSRFSNADSRAGSRSPDSQKSREMSSPPVVRPVRDILGENVPPLCIGERNKESDGRVGAASTDVQNTAPSSNPGSVDKKHVEHKRANSGSLIDFNSDPEPSDTIAPSTDGGNLALVPSSTNEKASDAPNVNSLESLLFELSAPAVVPVGSLSDTAVNGSAMSAAPVALSNTVTANASITNVPVVQSTGASPVGQALALPCGSSNSVFTGADSGPTAQLTPPSAGTSYNQPWTSSLAPNAQGPSSASAEQPSKPAAKEADDTCSGVGPLALQVVEAKSRERKELPADLFTASYSSFSAPVPSWQVRPPHGMGYGMQYHPTAMPVRPAFPSSAKSTNPFDLNDDSTQVQSPMFPSMSSLQGALPMVSAPTGLLPTSSFGIQSSQLMQSQSSPYASVMLPQSPSYGMGISPRAFMGQQLPNNVPPPRPQGIGGFGGTEDTSGSLITTQVPNRYPAPTMPNSFSSVGGNPFG